MVTNIGNQTTQYTLGSSSLFFLNAGDVVSSNTNGIRNSGFADAEVIVAGSIFADFFGVEFTFVAVSNTLAVTSTGVIQTGTVGVLFRALNGSTPDNARLVNDGVIGGYGIDGIGFATAGAILDVSVVNNGTIYGSNTGVLFDDQTSNGGLINTGKISGADGVLVEAFGIRIVNSGEILGEGSAYAFGTEYGIAVTGAGFQLNNSGVVGGTVAAFSGSTFRDVIFNSGDMLGAVTLGDGDDVYRAVGDGSTNGGVRGGDGKDELTGAAAVDDFGGGDGNDKISGNGGADVLAGDAGRDIIRGGDGDDIIEGGADGDLMLGGAGGDEFLYTSQMDVGTSGATRDEIRDFAQGLDIINMGAMVSGDFIFLGTGGFTGGSSPELRLAVAGGSTFVQLDYDGDGNQDGRILVRGVMDMTEADFIL